MSTDNDFEKLERPDEGTVSSTSKNEDDVTKPVECCSGVKSMCLLCTDAIFIIPSGRFSNFASV